MFKILVNLFMLVSAFSACSSALKRQCNNTNWFEHGSTVAKQGQRINADSFVQNCEKEKASINYAEMDKGFKQGMNEYCVPDYAFLVGKRGDFLNPDLCDVAQHRPMQQRHKAGLTEFCKPESAFSFGASGKKYNDICPPETEKDFLTEYRKGRKNYLTIVIQQKRRNIAELDKEVFDIDRRILHEKKELSLAERRSNMLIHSKLSPEALEVERKDIRDSMSDIQSRIRSSEQEIRKKRMSQTQHRQEIEEAEREITTLNF